MRILIFSLVVMGLASCGIGPDQPESAECDTANGIDACGAGLVCKVADGRQNATCYRKPGPAQPESAECDPAYGIDSCGAGLTCAALDGRIYPTCYPNGSRNRGEECTDNVQCGSTNCDNGGCGLAPNGALCAIASDCQSGRCLLGVGCY